MGQTIKLNGLEEFKKAMAMKSAAVKAGLPAAVAKAAKQAEEKAKSLVPKRTGNLQGSIHSSISGLNAEVATDERYAGFVEFGTAKHGGPQPYMRPAQTVANKTLMDEVIKLARK